MAAPGGKFFIEDTLNSKTKAKHHESYEQLWKTKWQMPVCHQLHIFPNPYMEVRVGT